MGVDLDNILKMGCWSRQSTFWKFYSKELEYIDKNRVAETIEVVERIGGGVEVSTYP